MNCVGISLPQNSLDWIILLTKISIIIFISFYLITNFNPYYEGNDAYSYAITAKLLANGTPFYSNSLSESTGSVEFIPQDHFYIKDENIALPAGYVGFFGLTTFVYLIAGNYGLFLLGPISGIIFLIISERIASHFFGKYVGLLTLLFLSTNHYLFRTSLNLQTEAIFSIFFILGCYFLISYFKNNKPFFIFVASSFFVLSTTMRTNGIIYLPIEIVCIVGLFLLLKFKPDIFKMNQNKSYFQNFIKNNQISKNYFIKIILISILPWIIFLIFWFSYYGYFYDDPFTNHVIVMKGAENTDKQFSSLFEINSKNFENIKQYSKYILPYQFPRVVDLTSNFDSINNFLGKDWLGIVSLLILSLVNFVSFKTKKKRLQISIFSLMILGTIWFFASITTEARSLQGVPGRYMFPAFTLHYMMMGFLIYQLFGFMKERIPSKFSISLRLVLFSILVMFFSFAFYFSPPGQAIFDETFQINNPQMYNEIYPIDMEGLSSNDVLISIHTYDVLDYGLIPFNARMIDSKISDNSFELLQKIDKQGYDVYIFKNTIWKNEMLYESMLNKKSISFIDFSPSFCKVIFYDIDIEPDINLKTDTTCM